MSNRLATGIGCGLLGLLLAIPVQAQPDRWLPETLMTPIDFAGIDDPATPLGEVLDQFARRYNLLFRINDRAFREEQLPDVRKTEVASPEPVAALPGIRLKVALQAVLDRVPSPSGATFLVRDGYVEITTNDAARAEIYGATHKGPYYPLVHLRGTEGTVAAMVAEVGRQGPVNVAIDPRVIDSLQAKPTLQLLNTPADTALAVLADAAGVQTVRLRNTFYLTTPERAAELRGEQATNTSRP